MPVPVVESADYRFIKIEKDLPGFDAMFLDENNELNIYTLPRVNEINRNSASGYSVY
jgi:hypothetical protein